MINKPQFIVGVVMAGIGLAMAVGAQSISSEAGYSGVGPNFLPSLVAFVLAVCGALLCWKAKDSGWQGMDDAQPEFSANWQGFAWISAALLANAALITTLGFIISCALCFLLAARGFRIATGKLGLGLRTWVSDFGIGVAIAAPVFWMFTKALAVNLPGLTQTGWL